MIDAITHHERRAAALAREAAGCALDAEDAWAERCIRSMPGEHHAAQHWQSAGMFMAEAMAHYDMAQALRRL